jgi:FAD/FMN-containing dehydrogenase
VLDTVATVGADLLSALSAALPETERAAFAADARRELEPFRERMPDEAYRHATEAAVARVVRHHYGLPDFTY